MLSLLSSKLSLSNTAQESIEYSGIKTVEIRHLSVILGDKKILDDIDLTLNRGEFTVLLGPNGTGKSTLLKALTGELNAKGEFSLFGQNRDSWPASLLAKHVGVLPQSSSLSFNFMAKEVIELGGIGLTMSNHQLNGVVTKNMRATDVEHLGFRSYPTLSGGEKQRVHLARVLTQLEQSGKNKILLLDEPTSALDIHHQHTTLALARILANQGATVVAVLHDLNLASQYADRIVMLNQGKIEADDIPAKVLKPEIIEAVYHHKVDIIAHPTYGHPVVIAC
ncbi:heme ABC transporter ATP-binding protein [Vibrio ziniensis]|uniref:Heme ABC transporter ATP-binding protein n=1 Tax=Vibrio ziniensis TaxID=2711221 RepID=A0A6G7CKX0_9VIBR|nr:heme ABC transporter ATP-binding protein [Vibrio ziniensis]QIH42749.1 heme ABC transporter ATP-binding protein [Vibrio ziniensis]